MRVSFGCIFAACALNSAFSGGVGAQATPCVKTTDFYVADGQNAEPILLNAAPSFFIKNMGQWERTVRFASKHRGLTVRLEPQRIVLHPRNADPNLEQEVMLEFEGGRPDAEVEGRSPVRARYHYFAGPDPSKWVTNVPAYEAVLYKQLYPSIDLRAYSVGGLLQYDVMMAPDARLSDVVIRVVGVRRLRIETDGAMVMETDAGALRQSVPASWYVHPSGGREAVRVRFRQIDEQRFGFEQVTPPKSLPLVVDPILTWSTFVGTSGWDEIRDVTISSNGHVLITGRTGSLDFPTTPGAFQSDSQNGLDAFVMELDPQAQGADQLVFSSFLGGSGGDRGNAVIRLESGDILLTGRTTSPDFPTTPGAFDTQLNGGGSGYDAFLARMSPDGSQLLHGTFWGGLGYDEAYALLEEPSGDLIVVGHTQSPDMYTSMGAYDQTYAGAGDGFILRYGMNAPAGEQALYSSYLGSAWDESITHVAASEDGMITVVGDTRTPDFPTTPGAPDSKHPGNAVPDVFLSQFDLGGQGAKDLAYSTLLGGDLWDEAEGLAAAPDGSFIIAGYTRSADFPTTPGAFDTEFNGVGCSNHYDAFVTQLYPGSNGLDDILYSSYLGGACSDQATDVVLDCRGVVTIVGWTTASQGDGFPTTKDAFDSDFDGGPSPFPWDGFVSQLELAGAGSADLLYSTFLGAYGKDRPQAVAADALGNIFVGGYTEATDFPTTTGAFDETHNGEWDGFISMFKSNLDDRNRNGIADVCEGTCTGDLDLDGQVSALDLALLLGAWGPNPGHPADLNGNDVVETNDLALLLNAWGPCP